ncbi:hypothetical protein LCGC14_1434960 [marine sediment metagenome]|uniref:Uncharacterized protein n=1 Tax=marine sediment metagenome TaxID=412755 RepID=A0A0F9JMY4_9ZZZZ
MSSKREDVIRALRDRLAAISVTNGYNTNAGQKIFLGETPTIGPNDPAASLAVVVGTDDSRFQGEHVVVALPVEVQAIVKADVSDPLLTIEAVIADIKRAVELPDRTFGGLLVNRGLKRGSTRPFERESGSEFVGAAVEYIATLAEGWGAP